MTPTLPNTGGLAELSTPEASGETSVGDYETHPVGITQKGSEALEYEAQLSALGRDFGKLIAFVDRQRNVIHQLEVQSPKTPVRKVHIEENSFVIPAHV